MRFPLGHSALLWSPSVGLAARALGAVLVLLLGPSAALGAEPPIRYLLDLREPASHLVRVTMTIPDARPSTEIQFPAWNNLYQIRDFVRNVQGLEAHCGEAAWDLVRMDLDTWRSRPEPCSAFEVRYAVYANEESVFSSAVNGRHAFMNFALLLFYLPRERERPVRVKFLLPAGWKLATLLEDGETPDEFKAANYDALADSPAEAGTFEAYTYTQNGATFRVVVHAGPADYSPDRLLNSLKKITAVETALMRDVPFSRYTFILHFERPGSGGGMEHRYGTAISAPAGELARHWERFEAAAAHEFFHVWNVKRIRPQSLEPIDYVHGNDTQDLWFSEGVTSAYGEMALLRTGLINRKTFYRRLAAEIETLQARPARRYQSLEAAGREAWLEKYSEYYRPERSISYYNKGAVLGFLLDLEIRHATGNRRSLDDVMHRLNEDFARRGRFFTQADLREVIRDLAPEYTGLDAFFRDYLSGTREIDYDSILGFAGLELARETIERPALGFLAVQRFDAPIEVESVDPGSNAERAGMARGDILLKMNGENLNGVPSEQVSSMKAGQKVSFDARRVDRPFSVEYALGRKQATAYRVEEASGATPDEVRVRQGWLEGKTERSPRRPNTGQP